MDHRMPNLLILYVENPTQSAAFYSRLLGREPVFAVPDYVAFDLGTGFMLGLLSRTSPDAVSKEGFELAFMVGSPDAVDGLHRDWRALGVDAEAPFDAVFGRTFAASDPDGHTLRGCLAD
jgi:catechol 2,3-dioxygenase-like lactoylglutathione lyase family enzyme